MLIERFIILYFLRSVNHMVLFQIGAKIKKAACIANVSENFVTSWNLKLTKAVQLMEVLILEHVHKLYIIEENFNLAV